MDQTSGIMNGKRIAICTTSQIHIDQRLQKTIQTLRKSGFDITVFCREPVSWRDPEVRIKALRVPKKGMRFYGMFNFRLVQSLREESFDVICSFDVDTLLAGYLATRNRRIAWIFDAHEWYEESPEIISRPMVKYIWQSIAKWLVPRTHHRYTVNRSIAAAMEKRYGVAFDVIYNFPLHQPFSNAHQTEHASKILLYQGMLNQDRGLEYIIKALSLLDPAFKLWIVGSGDVEDRLHELAQKHHVEDRIQWFGIVAPQELGEITKRAWLGLNVLTGASKSYYFSAANKFFDYVQQGVPVLTMGYPEYQLFIDQFPVGYLLEQIDAQSIAQRINQISEDSKTYIKRVEACRIAAQVWTWEAQEESLITIYRRLLNSDS